MTPRSIILALDFGSTHFKGRVFQQRKPISPLVQVPIATRRFGSSVEILPHELEKAFKALLAPLKRHLPEVDAVICSNQGPSLCVMDEGGKLLFPVITHMDRRSVREAKELISHFGEAHLLSATKNLPIPGGIASTSLRWLSREYGAILRKAHCLGSLNTFFMNALTGRNVMDPGNAAYLGLLSGSGKVGWSRDIAAFCGVRERQLPELADSDRIAGRVGAAAARRFGLKKEPRVYVGMMDASASIAAVEFAAGDLFHLSGTTDVIATVTDEPLASRLYLTRPLGFDGKWLSVRAISAGGETIRWAQSLFGVDPLRARTSAPLASFAPYLAGDRLSVETKTAEFHGMTLATTRDELAAAIRSALAEEATEGFEAVCGAVKRSGHRLTGKVWCSGGNKDFARYVHGLWRKLRKGGWNFVRKDQLGMAGLAALASRGEAE